MVKQTYRNGLRSSSDHIDIKAGKSPKDIGDKQSVLFKNSVAVVGQKGIWKKGVITD